jgi:RNA polymerase sigma factor (TIGR02999 family)
MSDVTQLLDRLDGGDAQAAEELLPLVYAELRRLAEQRLTRERSGQTLQPTALVHEAYLRLVDRPEPAKWNSRGHFFAAAAEAMRRILVEAARRKGRLRHGGELARVPLASAEPAAETPDDDLLALDEALEQFEEFAPEKAALVKLRYFAGLTLDEAAEALNLSRSTAARHWAYARAWLYRRIRGQDEET